MLNPWLSCGPRGITPPCPECADGQYSICRNFARGVIPPGIHTGNSSARDRRLRAARPGARVDVHPDPRRACATSEAVLADPFSVSLHAILKRPPAAGRDRSLVYGCGTLGLLAIAILRALHPDDARASRSRASRTSARSPSASAPRRAAARAGRRRSSTRVARETGARGAGALVRPALALRRRRRRRLRHRRATRRRSRSGSASPASRGAIVVTGVEVPRRFEWTPLYFKEIAVIGSNAFGVEEFEGRRRHSMEIYLDLVATSGASTSRRSSRTASASTSWQRRVPRLRRPGRVGRGEGALHLPDADDGPEAARELTHRPAAARRRPRGVPRGRLRPRPAARPRAARLRRRDQRAARGGAGASSGAPCRSARSSASILVRRARARASRSRPSAPTTPTSTAGGRAPSTSARARGRRAPARLHDQRALRGSARPARSSTSSAASPTSGPASSAPSATPARAHRRGPAAHAARGPLRRPPRLRDRPGDARGDRRRRADPHRHRRRAHRRRDREDPHRGRRAPRLRAARRRRGCSPCVLPEVARMRGVAQSPDYHPEGDVWTHTLLLLAAAARRRVRDARARRAAARRRQAALRRRARAAASRSTAIPTVGAEMAVADLPAAAAQPRRPGSASTIWSATTCASCRRRRCGSRRSSGCSREDGFDELLALARLDALASSRDLALRRCSASAAGPSSAPRTLRPPRLLERRTTCSRIGYAPGPRIGEILRALEDAQLEGEIATPRRRRALRRASAIPRDA